MITQDHVEDCRTAAALYSLGALPPEEKASFEQRLKGGCPLCTTECTEYACVVDEIALSVPAQSPNPSVRQRLLDRIGVSGAQSSKDEMKLVRASETPWRPLPVSGIEVRPLLEQKLCWSECSRVRFILPMSIGMRSNATCWKEA